MSFLINALSVSRAMGQRLTRGQASAYSAVPNPSPLFIFGNQKSGTTAIAGLLAAATGRTATLDFVGAREPFASRLYRGEIPLDTFICQNAPAFSTQIVKEPALTFVAPALMNQLPAARAIMIVRDPYDNIRSILDRLGLRGDMGTLDVSRQKINMTWRAVLDGSQFDQPGDHYISNLAQRWLRAANLCRTHDSRWTVVRYEDFNGAKTSTIETLAQSAGLAVTQDVSHLLDHAFQRRAAKRTLSTRDYFGPENFARIESVCAQTAASFGYDLPDAEKAAPRRAPAPAMRPITAHN